MHRCAHLRCANIDCKINEIATSQVVIEPEFDSMSRFTIAGVPKWSGRRSRSLFQSGTVPNRFDLT
jgi:hypothetical protein